MDLQPRHRPGRCQYVLEVPCLESYTDVRRKTAAAPFVVVGHAGERYAAPRNPPGRGIADIIREDRDPTLRGIPSGRQEVPW